TRRGRSGGVKAYAPHVPPRPPPPPPSFGGARADAPPPGRVDHRAPRHGDEPRARARRKFRSRPHHGATQRSGERQPGEHLTSEGGGHRQRSVYLISGTPTAVYAAGLEIDSNQRGAAAGHAPFPCERACLGVLPVQRLNAWVKVLTSR